jgi:hypothetical protein
VQPARGPLDHDDLEGIRPTPKAHQRAAATLEAWTRVPNRDDELSPEDLLAADAAASR